MQWIKFTYNGNFQHYINSSRMLMMALENIDITIPNKCHSFSLLGKLSGDSKMHLYVKVLTLNEDLVKDPKLVLAKLQEFHDNSSAPENSNSTPPSAFVSESAHPYKLTSARTGNKIQCAQLIEKTSSTPKILILGHLVEMIRGKLKLQLIYQLLKL
ncbi:hypothetical protein O181_099550 [Austropuccinia psidii MF-1]|uniref:Uncharacterized protein n=1 Tax=Austropuccinia psidii MF-1 TaxID=1389203 RepID=A0A9Q3PFZ5_9BASI|nr:hypothetical protein [Austropuccinia psidii MF-1]